MFKIGLIGKKLQNSFSKKLFEKKFNKENINDFNYNLFEISSIEKFKSLIEDENIIGLNVTSPFKEIIINYVDELDEISRITKSVNTIFINNKKKKIKGYNTDVYGFEKSLISLLPKKIKINALVLGNGGVSKSICYVLKKRDIDFLIVSRRKKKIKHVISYEESEKYLQSHKLIINTTILGSKDHINLSPKINYEKLSKENYLFDVVYNPSKSLFLNKGSKKGAKIMNGKKMLIAQAEHSFAIWKKNVQLIKKC